MESELGQGSRFYVTVPVTPLEDSSAPPTPRLRTSQDAGTSSPRDAAAPTLAMPATPSRPPPLLSRTGRRMRCLLVDDHSLNRRLCGRLLELQGGLEVETADDGDVALQALMDSYAPGAEPFDFCLMDLQARRFYGSGGSGTVVTAACDECLRAHRCRAWTACTPRASSAPGSGRSRTCMLTENCSCLRSAPTCSRRRRLSAYTLG